MPQDAFTLRYLCEELNSLFKGGKINRIVQPDNDEVIFTVYTGSKTIKLSLCVNPSSPRIGVVDEEKACPLTAPNFCMLLRKHLLSATINEISLVGFDRIVRIDLTPSSEFFDVVDKQLYVELMGRYSNVILTENGKILGGNRGINVFDNGIRPLFVGQDYVYPPIGQKKHPADKTLKSVFDGVDKDSLSNVICANVQGIATSTSREFANNLSIEYGKGNGVEIFEKLNDFLYNSKKQPCVCVKNDQVIDVCAFPYKELDGDVIYFDNLWEAEQFYYKKREMDKQFLAKKDRAKNIIQAQLKKTKKKLTVISSREKDALSCEQNKIFGELILANIYKISVGQESLEAYNYYDNTSLIIPLDKNLSPSKNAEKYYKKYNKQKRTLSAIEPQKKGILEEISYLDSVLLEIDMCEGLEDVINIYRELEQVGLIKVQNTNKKEKSVEYKCREYVFDGFTIKAGRNNNENDKLTFSAKPDDVWVHAKDYPSSHVLVVSNGNEIPEKVVAFAGEICAYFSQGRESGKVEIVYTNKRNVKKPSKSKPGFCTYEKYKSIMVVPKKNAEFAKND